MTPTKIKDLEYSLLKKDVGAKEYKALPSAVIYGANASGKTNIIEAMADFKKIILSANILDNSLVNLFSRDDGNLALVPNINSSNEDPTTFEIKFIVYDKKSKENFLFHYLLSLQLGCFAQSDFKRKIVLEQLNINDRELFKRENETINFNLNNVKKFTTISLNENESGKIIKRLTDNLVPTDLFLMTGFKIMYDSYLVSIFEKWFANDFDIVCASDKVKVSPLLQEEEKKDSTMVGNKIIDKILKELGIGSQMGHRFNNQTKRYELMSLIKTKNLATIAIPSERFESLGTIRLSHLVVILHHGIINGKTLVMDEFDASIHPMIIMNIINLFHNDEINKNGAQLIFNTHNPIFLNNTLFRRDEIKFVDYLQDKKTSELYCLSDFGTNSDQSVRSTTDYMKNYFINRYGAIKEIDLSQIFKKEEMKDDK
jgi:AAA15 family ATPase/GTPase